MAESKYAIYNDDIIEFSKHYSTNTDIARAIVDKYGINDIHLDHIRRYVSRFLDSIRNAGATRIDMPNGTNRVYEETNSKATVSFLVDKEITNIDDAIKYANVDLSVWEPIRWRFNTWQQQAGGKNIVQVRIDFKKRNPDSVDPIAIAEKLKDIIAFKTDVPKPPKITHLPGNKMLEICIYDLHFGMLAWAPESGNDYNLDIARERFLDSIHSLASRASGTNISTILFSICNDFFHSDKAYPFPTTTRGTPQQDDTRWQKIFTEGIKVIIEAVDYLKQIAPVRLVIVPGNHDFERSYYAGVVLDVKYEYDKLVTVDNSPTTRKYFQFGKCLVGMTHGNEEKLKDLPMIMAQEVPPEIWANTKHREWHLGHVHHKRLTGKKSYMEMQGVVVRDIMTAPGEDMTSIAVRHIGSVAATDAWHAKKGYIGSQRSAEAFIWDYDLGLEAVLIHHINP